MTSTRWMAWAPQFPISLAVEGDACYRRMAEAGLDTVLFCAMIYSPYRLLLPRYPQKGLYSLEEGRYYYSPEVERYRGLPFAPLPSADFSGRDLLAQAVNGAHGAGLGATAWLTTFANGEIAKRHPAWAFRNLYDSADRLFLCFNNPDVREYSLRIAEEMAERYALDEIMLDKIPQTCIEVDALGGRLDPVLRTLASFCFCPSCGAAARRAGIDLEACREKARALAAETLATPPHLVSALADDLKGDTGIPLLLIDHPWILDVLRFRVQCIRSFLEEMRKRIDAKRKGVSLSAAFLPPTKAGHDAAHPRSWLAAQSYAAYKDAAIDRIHCVIHWDEDVVEYDTRQAVRAVSGGRVRICTHVKACGNMRPEQLAGLTRAVRRGGADGIAYFCYDLMTDEMLEAVRRAR